MTCPPNPVFAADGSLMDDGKEPMVCELEPGHEASLGLPNWHVATVPDGVGGPGSIVHWGEQEV